MKKIITCLGIALAFTMMLTSCGKVVPKLVELAAPDGFLELEMDVGETTTVDLVKTFTPKEATTEQIAEALATANLTWKIDNPEVVEVIPDDGGGGGSFVAKTEGTANVEVSGGDDDTTLLVTFKVTVVKPIVSLQSATAPEEMTLTIKGEEFSSEELVVELTPVDATDVEVSFASDDETVATVDKNGIVTAVAVGETVIRAEVIGDFGMTDLYSINLGTKVIVTVAPEEITLDTKEGWVYVGGTVQLVPHTLPTEAETNTYTYASSDSSIAIVSETGFVTGKKVGTTVITVTSNENSDLKTTYSITIKVYANTGGGNSGNGTNSTGGAGPGPTGGAAPAGGNGGNTGGGTTPTQPNNPAPQQPAPAPEPPAPPAPAPPPGDGSPGNPLPFDPLPENPNPGDVGGL